MFLGGSDVTDAPPYKRDVNTVFQSYALFPHLTVEKNVAFGLERKKVSKEETRKRVGDALELVQLGHLAKRKPGQLSGGQAQRVALARALVNRPRALLLDEPLGALDLRLRKQLQIELKRIQQDIGITFVHVTHDQEEAMSMADTIAVMNGGQIEQAGSAADLYERPHTAFVANFLGISNLVDARIKARDNGHAKVETHDGAALHVPVGPLQRRGRRARGRAAGEDHAGAGGRGRAGRRERAARQDRRRRVPGHLDPVRDPDRGGRGAQRVHAEHARARSRTRSASGATCSSRGTPSTPSWSPVADPRTTRRVFLGRAGSLALASSLAGCGIEGTLERARKVATPIPTIRHPKVPIGNWTFSNWPLYIDKKVLKTFDKQFGGHVKYVEDINDNDEFYGKVRQQLQAQQSIGRDIVVLTDPMMGKWVRNRYVQPLDKKNIPNVIANLVDNLKSVPYDKKRRVHRPVAVGRDRPRLQPEEDRPRAELDQRHLRPEVQGPGDDALRAV